jgi:galactokinase
MWFKPHLDWLLGALREKGGTGAEVVGAAMGGATAIAPPHAIAAVQAELGREGAPALIAAHFN